jgi:hypothetical protein
MFATAVCIIATHIATVSLILAGIHIVNITRMVKAVA